MNQTHIAAAIAVQSGAPSMAIGGNLGGIYSYGGVYLFNNVLLQAGEWQRYSGSGSFTQQCGVLTPTVGTDVFRAYISNSGSNLPTGTYTVFNPDGCNIAVGNFGTPTAFSAWTTATQFTFTYTAGSGLLALWCQGSAGFTANNGRAGMIAPFDSYCLSDWQAGVVWRRDFLSYISNLKLKTLRFMDTFGPTYYNIEDSWSDRTPAEPISLMNSCAASASGFGATLSYELIADLCNRVGAEPYLTLPVRLNDAYVQNVATTLDARLNAGKSVWVEYGNELWNPGSAYAEAGTWATYLPFTKFTATADYANQKFSLASHGMASGAGIVCFPSKENRFVSVGARWPFSTGGQLYASPVDANSFRAYMTPAPVTATITRSGTTASITIPNSSTYSSDFILEVAGADQAGYNGTFPALTFSGGVATYAVSGTETTPATGTITCWVRPNIVSGQVNQLFIKQAEAGKSSVKDTNIGNRSLEIWNLMQAAAPSRKIVTVMGAWAVSTGTITSRLAPAGVNAATNYAAIATYWGTEVHGWRLSMSSGSVTPQAWCRKSGKTVYAAVFPSGTVPTRTMVKNGTGAVGYSTRTTTATAGSWDSFTSVSVTAGTSYVAAFVLVDSFGYEWLSYGTFTAATSGAVSINPTNANELLRNKIDIYKSFKPWIDSHAAVLNGPKLMCYEGGADYYGVSVTELKSWVTTYIESAESGQAVAFNLRMLAAMGVKAFNQFTLADTDVWGWGNNYTDTSDAKYQAALPFEGKSKKLKLPVANDISASQIASAPAYPYTVATLADSAATHTIVQGDDAGNLGIVGNQLKLVNGTGISWTNPVLRTVKIVSEKNGLLADQTVQFYTGDAWYDVDAWVAWNSVADTDTTQVNPVVGGVMARGYGSTYATASAGLWALSGVMYKSSTSTTANVAKSFLVAGVVDVNTATSGKQILKFGNTTYVNFSIGSALVQTRAYFGSGKDSGNLTLTTTVPTGPHVLWAYYDYSAGKMYFGRDQSVFGTTWTMDISGVSTNNIIQLNNDIGESPAKVGSVQFVRKDGMTQAQALAIVAKMQALHGIT